MQNLRFLVAAAGVCIASLAVMLAFFLFLPAALFVLGGTLMAWAAREIWDHAHNAPFAVPLLVMDLYEHAYHLDFGAGAAAYVDAFLANADWTEVGRRAEWPSKVKRG